MSSSEGFLEGLGKPSLVAVVWEDCSVGRGGEKYLQAEEQKEDINYPLRSQSCDLFFYL